MPRRCIDGGGGYASRASMCWRFRNGAIVIDRLIKSLFLFAFILLSAMAGAMAADRDWIEIRKNAAGEWERVR